MTRTHPIADAYLLWRLFKVMLRGITGVPTDASLLTTLFAVGVLMNALRRVTAPLRERLRPKPPSLASAVMAAAVAREIPGSLGGAHTRGEPLAGTMISVSLVAQLLQVLRPVINLERKARAAFPAFVRRYGI